MAASLPLLSGKKGVFKGCLWCGNGGLCVGSFPDPTSAEGPGRWVPSTGGAGRHGTGLPVPAALLEEGPGEQGESDPRVLGNNRECPEGMHTGTAQRLFVSPSSCCGAEGPAWGGFARTSGSLWVPRGEACLFFPHFPLWEKESSHVPQL